MVLSEQAKGSTTMDGTEQDLFTSYTNLAYYQAYVFLHNMEADDKIIIRVYVNDPQTSTERLYIETPYYGVQTDTTKYIPSLPTDSYRITCEQESGTYRAVTWILYDI